MRTLDDLLQTLRASPLPEARECANGYAEGGLTVGPPPFGSLTAEDAASIFTLRSERLDAASAQHTLRGAIQRLRAQPPASVVAIATFRDPMHLIVTFLTDDCKELIALARVDRLPRNWRAPGEDD